MAIRPSHIKDETGREASAREARHARLRSLADSINDTARMARNSLSLLLIVALYLVLTLISSTDENLLRNGQVVLPQVGVGISVAQSYIFAPLVFLYLHAQLLFLLRVLAQKVRTFELALKEEFPGAANPNKQREECRDWLSAFTFVQRLRLPPGGLHMSKALAWFGIEAVPVILLFVLDLSFVRYQSNWITWSHHIVFVVDLMLLTWFNWRVFGGGLWGLWANLTSFFRTLCERVAKILGQPGISVRGRPLHAERRPWEILEPTWGAVVFCMALLLILAAHPPTFYPKTVREDQRNIWGWNEEGFLRTVWNGGNPLDAGPCKYWRLACRYLSVSNKRRVVVQTQDMSGPRADEPGDKGFATMDLAGRNLRFANFQYAQLRGVDFRAARLQGANLRRARLQGAHLRRAQLQGANLRRARLQNAYLREAQLQNATLWRAQLQNANLGGARLQNANLLLAQLQGAYLGGAQLQNADLRRAQLQNANLRRAQLQDANLSLAQLQNAYLEGAQLQNADLQAARLQNANLREAQLQDANLLFVQLQGADLRGAQVQGADLSQAWLQGADLGGAQVQGMEDFLARLQSAEDLLTQLQGTEDFARLQGAEDLLTQLQDADDLFAQLQDTLSDPVPPEWEALAYWTAELACKDEYTTRSSLNRWRPDGGVPLFGWEDYDFDKARERVLKALADARKTGEECPGLHSISDDEWNKFVDGWP